VQIKKIDPNNKIFYLKESCNTPVIGVPQLGLYEELLPLDDPLAEELLQSLADDVLVVVVVGAVDEPVAGLNGRDDSLLGLLWGRLPGAQAQPRHPRTIVQLHVRIHLGKEQ